LRNFAKEAILARGGKLFETIFLMRANAAKSKYVSSELKVCINPELPSRLPVSE
jgi:hypothetical protein